MKYKSILLGGLVALLMLFFSCSKISEAPMAEEDDESIKRETLYGDESNYISGVVRVKLTEDFYHNLQLNQLRGESNKVDAYLAEIGAKSMSPVFTNLNPKYEKRHKKAGLHLWFNIELDQTRVVTRAAEDIKDLPGMQIVEPVLKIMQPQSKVIFATPSVLRNVTTGEGIPNDARFSEQWHLQNTIQEEGFIRGVDINAVEAWKQGVTGDPKVIVAVLDGGVQTDHPDIAANLWNNPNPTQDASGHWDIHGRNFNNDVNKIDPDNHGTHVAGLIAAVRNNNIGVAGVAGGDGTKDSGVRIMSCQIFSDIHNLNAVENALIYAADHGAVIANNSWGAGPGPGPDIIPQYYKVAIDYFTDYAGCDEDGNQLKDSPMKGGLAFFAAGNQNSEIWYIPGNYSRVVAVTSVGPTAKKAAYSNYGVWTDIAAPGGDWAYGNPEGLILSTVKEGMYGYMQGTSQATPITTGIAALIVSKFGGPGFTNEDLRAKLLGALRPFDIDARNLEFAGKIGAGIVDANKALSENENQKPDAVSENDIKVEPSHSEIVLKWPSVKDPDDGTATYYNLYCSENGPLNEASIAGMKPMKLNALEFPFGKEVIFQVKNLKLNTQYYFAVESVDRWGLKSEYTFFQGKTLENHLPELSIPEGTKLLLRDGNKVTVEVTVKDKDGHQWNYEIKGVSKGVTHRRDGNKIIIDIRRAVEEGVHMLKVIVSDPFGSSTLDIPFEVGLNHAPTTIANQEKIFLPINSKDFSLRLDTFFSDADGDELKYEVRSTVPQVASAEIVDGKLIFKVNMKGTTHFEVTAIDVFGAKARLNFDVQVVNDDIVYVVYPIPVRTNLNVRLSDEVHYAQIRIFTPMGTEKMKKFVTVRSDSDRYVVLDMSKIEVGSYVLEVTANGKVFKQNVIKN